MSEQYVIVGAGLAGAKAAETLRAEGFPGRIALIGDEPVRPYERPPLSKGVLLGTATPADAFVHSIDWFIEQDIDLRTGVPATRIDRAGHAIELADGTRVGYDRLLLATGSSARRLYLPGGDLDGVRYLRTMAEAEELRRRLGPGLHVVIVGAGWIGLEVAAAARTAGAEVTVLEVADLPLQRVLGDEVAGVFAALHRAHGVRLRFGTGIRAIRGQGSVQSVLLPSDEVLPADLVVIGVGSQPNTRLAAEAGLTVDNGIRVDANLGTDDPLIFAAGDVANADHPVIGAPIRVEHWANALHGGPAAARAMLGQPVSYDRLPYFYTDQYDLGCEYVGHVAPGQHDQVVFRGDPAVTDRTAPAFIAFWLRDKRVLAAMNVNVWDVNDTLRRLATAGYAGHTLDPAVLRDPRVPLDELG